MDGDCPPSVPGSGLPVRCNYAPQVSAAPCPEEARAVGSGRGGYYRAAGEGVCLRPPKCKLHTPETPTPPGLRPLPPPPGGAGAVNGIARIPTGPERDIRIPRSAGEPRGASCSIQPDTQTRMREESPRTLDRGDIASGEGLREEGRPLPQEAIPATSFMEPPPRLACALLPPPRGAGAVSAIPDGNRLMGVCTWDNRAFERSNSRTRGQVPMQGSSLGGGDRGGDRGGGPPPPLRHYLKTPLRNLTAPGAVRGDNPLHDGPGIATLPPGLPLKTRIQLSYPQSIPLSEVLNESPHTNRGFRP